MEHSFLKATSEALSKVIRNTQKQVETETTSVSSSVRKLFGMRERLGEMRAEPPLSQLKEAAWVLERVQNEQIPPSALLELVSFTLLSGQGLNYRLLAEPDVTTGAGVGEREERKSVG